MRGTLKSRLTDFGTEILDQYGSGARGRLVHEYLLRMDFFDDEEEARRIYEESDSVDDYLDKIDLTKAAGGEASKAGGSASRYDKIDVGAFAFVSGALIGWSIATLSE